MHLSVVKGCGLKAETFFAEVCTKLLRARSNEARRAGGRFAFRLKGNGGGNWLIDLGRAAVVKNPSSLAADVTVSMSASDFEALLARELDTRRAFTDKRIEIAGERHRLIQLGPILGPL